jgi:TonB family protein
MKSPVIVLLGLLGCASAGRTADGAARLSVPVCSEDIVAVPRGSLARSDSLRMQLRETKLRNARLVETDTVPELVNERDVFAELVRQYRAILREADVNGDVLALVVIDTIGVVTDHVIVKPSGHLQLDLASAKIYSMMRFTPALADGCRAPSAAVIPVQWSIGDQPPG